MPKLQLEYHTPKPGEQRTAVLGIISLVCALFPVVALLLGARGVACAAMFSPFVGLVTGFVGYIRAPRYLEWISALGMMVNAAVILIGVLVLPGRW
jgi:hypothetical protein